MDHLETINGNRYPHYWNVAGGKFYPDDLSVNAASVVSEDQTDVDGASDYMVIKLVSSTAFALNQSFKLDPKVNVTDFPIPLEPGSARREMSEGYLSSYTRLLGKQDAYTFEMSLRMRSGRINVSAKFFDIDDQVIASSDSRALSRTTNSTWSRVTLRIPAPIEPANLVITFQRADRTELAEVHIGNMQLVHGSHDSAPYTGDSVYSAIPKDSVMMFMGTACPPGFVKLEEPESQATPEEWLAADARIKPRFRAFPMGSKAPTNQSLGSPTHNRSNYKFNLIVDQVRQFESFLSKFGQSVSTNPNEFPSYNSFGRSPADEAAEGTSDHQHNVSDAGSIPVNRQFLFCRKI
jgi:hypothetical protein